MVASHGSHVHERLPEGEACHRLRHEDENRIAQVRDKSYVHCAFRFVLLRDTYLYASILAFIENDDATMALRLLMMTSKSTSRRHTSSLSFVGVFRHTNCVFCFLCTSKFVCLVASKMELLRSLDLSNEVVTSLIMSERHVDHVVEFLFKGLLFVVDCTHTQKKSNHCIRLEFTSTIRSCLTNPLGTALYFRFATLLL